MLDKTITNALLALRAQIIRNSQNGLFYVEALLVARCVDPAAHHVPRKAKPRFKHAELRIAILTALREGPLTSRAVAERVLVANPHLTADAARHKVHRGFGR